MTLDINTPRGQESVEEEKNMLRIIRNYYPLSTFIHTPIRKAALIDGLIIKDNELLGIFESKCRRESLDSFRQKYDNMWMISYRKLIDGCNSSKSLAVPFWGFLYLVNDQKVIIVQITDSNGRFIHIPPVERKQTSKSCNGGTMIDTCGYIDIGNGYLLG